MRRSKGTKLGLWLLGVPMFAVGSAFGQLSDGNFDNLAVGTPPDCTQAAGAWSFPEIYQTNALCELDPSQFSIVASSSFDPTLTGNSLALNIDDAASSFHLPNILATPITPAAGQVVRSTWDMWVAATGDGATVYVGADMGGGGFSNASDRGPQVSWFGDGTVQYNSAGINTVLVQSYARGVWQHARVDIHLDTQTFDFYLSSGSQPPQLIQSGLMYRVAPAQITMIDRWSVAHFGATLGLEASHAFFDNITLALVGGSTGCYPNCDRSTAVPFLNVNDFICFQQAFAAGASYANCDNSTAPPVLNVNDFICFQQSFATGCTAP